MGDHLPPSSTPLPSGPPEARAIALADLVAAASTTRRDFLASMGFTLTAATMAA